MNDYIYNYLYTITIILLIRMGNQCSQESNIPQPKTKSRTLTNTMIEQIHKPKP